MALVPEQVAEAIIDGTLCPTCHIDPAVCVHAQWKRDAEYGEAASEIDGFLSRFDLEDRDNRMILNAGRAAHRRVAMRAGYRDQLIPGEDGNTVLQDEVRGFRDQHEPLKVPVWIKPSVSHPTDYPL